MFFPFLLGKTCLFMKDLSEFQFIGGPVKQVKADYLCSNFFYAFRKTCSGKRDC